MSRSHALRGGPLRADARVELEAGPIEFGAVGAATTIAWQLQRALCSTVRPTRLPKAFLRMGLLISFISPKLLQLDRAVGFLPPTIAARQIVDPRAALRAALAVGGT